VFCAAVEVGVDAPSSPKLRPEIGLNTCPPPPIGWRFTRGCPALPVEVGFSPRSRPGIGLNTVIGKPIAPPSIIGTSEPVADVAVVMRDGMVTEMKVIGLPDGSTVVTVEVTAEVTEEPIVDDSGVGNSVGRSTERETDIEISGPPPEEVLIEDVCTPVPDVLVGDTRSDVVVTKVVELPEGSTVVTVELAGTLVVVELTVVGLSVGKSVGRSTDNETEIEINGPPDDVLADDV